MWRCQLKPEMCLCVRMSAKDKRLVMYWCHSSHSRAFLSLRPSDITSDKVKMQFDSFQCLCDDEFKCALHSRNQSDFGTAVDSIALKNSLALSPVGTGDQMFPPYNPFYMRTAYGKPHHSKGINDFSVFLKLNQLSHPFY